MATTFQYSVRDRADKLVTGTLDADSPTAVAQRLEEKHIVIHGDDLDRDGKYGGRTTALGAPLEGELLVACGKLERVDTNR